MLTVILCIASLLPQSRPADTTFHVERVYVHATYNSGLVLKLANTIVPPDKLVDQSDIACLVNDLKTTGLFADVRARVVPSREDSRKLILSCSPRRDIARTVIAEITFGGLPLVDENKFRQSLRRRGVSADTPITKYSYQELNEKVDESIREAVPTNLIMQYQGSSWITFQSIGPSRARLIVFPQYSGCNSGAK